MIQLKDSVVSRKFCENEQVGEAPTSGKRSGKLHYDNAPVTKVAIAKTGFELVEHPLYSPDLVSIDYQFFTWVENDFRQIFCFQEALGHRKNCINKDYIEK